MSQISTKLWKAFLPGEPPPGCTYEQFCAARDMYWSRQDKLWAVQYLQEVQQCTNKEFVAQATEWVLEYLNELP